MKNRMRLSAALLSIIAAAACFGVYSKNPVEAKTLPQEPEKSAADSQQQAANMSAQPASAEPESLYGPSFAYLAWNLFLQAMAPTHGSLTFETWTEQCELSPGMVGCSSAASVAAAAKAGGNGKVRLLHGSAMAQARKIAGSDCGAMTTTSIGGYPPPSNLTRNAMYCEEVFVNPVEADFVKRDLATLASQQAYGKERNGTINFPGTETNDTRLDLDSLEVKVDWVPVTSYSNPTFACPDPTNSLYTETINGTCYALAAIHITSKVMPNWIWATFEPNNNVTNPNRCDPKLYGTCFDPWGTTSSQPYGKGQTAQQSPELHQAMAEAHLNPAFSNYFLTGVQTQFVDNYGKPIPLGNSFVEFNQGVPPGKSSCITCHQYANFDGKQPPQGEPEDNFGRPPHGGPSTGYACNQNQSGNCTPVVVPNSTSQDFSWMLGLMPYSAASTQRPPAPEAIAARPPAVPAPVWPANLPPNQARVSWDSRGLKIEASNSSLNQILHQVATDTGAKLEGLAQDQRVFGSYGPGPGCNVLLKLLDGSGYNVLMIGGRDADTPLEIVLSARSPASPQRVANNRNRINSQDDQAGKRVEPEPQPDDPPESPRPQPIQNPFGNGGPTRDPLEFMQEILQRQQQIDQQPQQQDQQNNPQQ